ncbi:MAG: hypothetical protein R3B54_09110 [Bdellovibrionota bacterium]
MISVSARLRDEGVPTFSPFFKKHVGVSAHNDLNFRDSSGELAIVDEFVE